MPIPLSAGDDNEIRFAGQHVLRPEQFSHLDTKMFMVLMLCGVHKCPQHVRVRGGQKLQGVQAKHNSTPSSSPAAFQRQFAVDGKPQTKTQGPRVNQDNFPPDKQLGKAFWKTKPQGCRSTSHLHSNSTFHQSAPGQHRQVLGDSKISLHTSVNSTENPLHPPLFFSSRISNTPVCPKCSQAPGAWFDPHLPRVFNPLQCLSAQDWVWDHLKGIIIFQGIIHQHFAPSDNKHLITRHGNFCLRCYRLVLVAVLTPVDVATTQQAADFPQA